MKLFSKPVLSVLLAFGLVISFSFPKAHAEIVRKPVGAGSFYPADPPQLTGMIDRLTHKAQKTPVRIPQYKLLKAIIMPHAGYIYSGWTAAHASLVLKKTSSLKSFCWGRTITVFLILWKEFWTAIPFWPSAPIFPIF